MADTVRFEPNTPVRLSLEDPQAADYDSELHQGTFQTTDARTLRLPRPAVVLLYQLEPRPGEEIQITRYLKKHPVRYEWDICLTPESERIRAREEIAANEAQDPQNLAPILEASIQQARESKALPAVPTPIRKPVKREAAEQPRLFDRRGTGTDGPAPATEPQRAVVPAVAASPTRTRPVVIPWNVAFREVAAWVASELAANKLQWSDEAQQAMVCTCLIAEVKAGRIGPWERGQ